MTDKEMYEMYRNWILEQTDPAYEINEKSGCADHWLTSLLA